MIRMDLVLEGILHPGEVDRFVAGALETSAGELADLSQRVRSHLAAIEAVAARRAVVDVDTAREVAAALDALLGIGDRLSAPQRALVRGAAEYFIQDDDELSDTHDIVGFDDDARIVSAVADALGRNDLRVTPG